MSPLAASPNPKILPWRVAWLVIAVLALALAACGDTAGGAPATVTTAPPATATVPPATSMPSTTAVAARSDAEIAAAFTAAVVAGDRTAAAAVAGPQAIALLEPWDPYPDAALFAVNGGVFEVILQPEDNIECSVADGLVQSCAFLLPGGGRFDGLVVTTERLSFPRGEYGTFVSGGAVLGERSAYLVEAAAGQSLLAKVASLEDNAVFDVYGPSGQLLATEEMDRAVLLPEDGDYEIVVGSLRGNTTFDLEVYVFDATPVRFAAGTSGATISGGIVRGERSVYVLEAAGGQTMSVAITSSEDNAVVDLYGPTGPPLVTDSKGVQVVLPESGPQQIVVAATRGNATYELAITITGP